VGTVDAAIARSQTDRKKMSVHRNPDSPAARRAVTHYKAIETFGERDKHTHVPAAALIECRLETGRTHQIRVHMSHIGVPVLGDPVYGRQMQLTALGSGEGHAAAIAAAKKCQATSGCIPLPTATFAARTQRALGIDNHMANLAREALRTSLQHATRNQATANSSAQRDHPHIARTCGCAMFPFAKCAARCIIFYPDLFVQSSLKLLAQWQFDCTRHIWTGTNNATACN
jgi:hypothetical protein